MKKLIYYAFLSYIGITCCAQEPYKNRIFMGFSAFGDLPQFNFKANRYFLGIGGTCTVFSPKITLLDSNQLWLRFGGSISSARQGSNKIDFSGGYAEIKNSYLGLNFITRLSWEKEPRWRPFLEAAANWNVFESQYNLTYTGNSVQKYNPRVFHNGYLGGCSIGGGYMFRITDGFLLEAKLSYLQTFNKIAFARIDRIVQSNGDQLADVKHATPSMVILQIGILFRLSPLKATSSDEEPFRTQPQDTPSVPQPQKSIPRKDSKYPFHGK